MLLPRPFKRMDDPEIVETFGMALDRLDVLGIAYVHLGEADWDDAPTIPDAYRADFSRRFRNSLIVAGRYTAERAQAVLVDGYADFVAFGRAFIATHDPPHPLRLGPPLPD